MPANTTTIPVSNDGTNGVFSSISPALGPGTVPAFNLNSFSALPPTPIYNWAFLPVYPLPGFIGAGSYAMSVLLAMPFLVHILSWAIK